MSSTAVRPPPGRGAPALEQFTHSLTGSHKLDAGNRMDGKLDYSVTITSSVSPENQFHNVLPSHLLPKGQLQGQQLLSFTMNSVDLGVGAQSAQGFTEDFGVNAMNFQAVTVNGATLSGAAMAPRRRRGGIDSSPTITQDTGTQDTGNSVELAPGIVGAPNSMTGFGTSMISNVNAATPVATRIDSSLKKACENCATTIAAALGEVGREAALQISQGVKPDEALAAAIKQVQDARGEIAELARAKVNISTTKNGVEMKLECSSLQAAIMDGRTVEQRFEVALRLRFAPAEGASEESVARRNARIEALAKGRAAQVAEGRCVDRATGEVLDADGFLAKQCELISKKAENNTGVAMRVGLLLKASGVLKDVVGFGEALNKALGDLSVAQARLDTHVKKQIAGGLTAVVAAAKDGAEQNPAAQAAAIAQIEAVVRLMERLGNMTAEEAEARVATLLAMRQRDSEAGAAAHNIASTQKLVSYDPHGRPVVHPVLTHIANAVVEVAEAIREARMVDAHRQALAKELVAAQIMKVVDAAASLLGPEALRVLREEFGPQPLGGTPFDRKLTPGVVHEAGRREERAARHRRNGHSSAVAADVRIGGIED